MKIHLGDNVLVTAGKDRGKTGKVSRIMKKSSKIVVEKVNFRTRHIKKRPGQAGQKIRYEAPIVISNAMVICPHCSKATRVGYVFVGGATQTAKKKQRICKKCSQSLDTGVVTPKRTKKR